MKNVLVLKASILAEHSQSNALVDHFIRQLSADVTTYDLGQHPLPYYDLNAATGTRGEPQNEAQKAALALSNKLIEEVKASDLLVFGVPMYNLGIPAQLKTYIDYLNRAGVTFQYTANGPEGLIKGKKAVVILTHGGMYHGTPLDLARQYMQAVLNFIGITEIDFVYAEGFGYGAEAAEKAQTAAQAELDRLAQTL